MKKKYTMKKIQLVLLALAIVIISCSKNQKVVNQLEGTWKVTSVKENGVAQPDSTYKNSRYTFEKCKVKKGACPGTLTEDGKSIGFTYDISDKGKKMTITVFGVSETSDILEHSKSKFVWRSMDGNDETETTIEKE